MTCGSVRSLNNDNKIDKIEKVLNNSDGFTNFIEHEERPAATEKEKKQKKVPYYRLFRFATKLDILFIVLGTICSIIAGILQPYVMILFGEATGHLVDYASKYNESLNESEKQIIIDKLEDGINSFIVDMCIAGAITIVTMYLAGVMFNYSCLRQSFTLRRTFLQKTLDTDISWFDTNKTGDFSSTFTNNITKIEEGIGEKLVTFIYVQTIFVSGIIVAIVLGWKLALVCLVSLPASTLIMSFISWLSTKFSKQEMEAYGAAGKIAEEVLSSVRTVVAFDGQDKEFERYEKHLIFAKNNNIKKAFFNGISSASMWFFVYASYALSFWYGVGLILEERNLPEEERDYTPAKMVSVFFCTLAAVWNFGMGAPYFEIFGSATGAAAQLYELIDNEPKINASKNKGDTLDQFKGDISFKNVYFHYPSRVDVKILQGFNLNIAAGETVALVGSSGCGKSTCIQLLQRFYDPVAGEVSIDNVNINNLNLTWLRGQIGMVGQEPILFATTIKENIKYGNLQASDQEIKAAAKKANAHNFIMNLPHGYETVIGERGAQLSGGQKQRIAIARALIRKPKILLLDEATSALDTTSEAEVQAALDAVSGECTTIIVAHRLSTIRNAHRIVVVSNGKVIEQGNHAQLMKIEGFYYKLVVSQGLTETEDLSHHDLTATTDNNEEIMQEKQSISASDEDISEEEKEFKESTILAILKLNRPEWSYIFIACISAIVSGSALPVYGVVFGDIIGILANSDADYVHSQTNKFCLFFVILGIVVGCATIIELYSFGVAGEKLTLRIRGNLFKTILNQEMAYFDRTENGVGALCAKLSGEAAAVQGAGGIRIGTLINSFSTFILATSISLYFNWKLALSLLSFAPVILMSIYFEGKFTQADTQSNQKYLENSAKIAVEAIANIRTVASLGCEQMFYNQYVDELFKYTSHLRKQAHFRSFVLSIARSIMYFAYAVGLGYGAHLMVYEKLSYEVVMKVSEVVIAGSWSIGNAFSFSPNFQKGLQAANRMFKLMKREPKIKNVVSPLTLDHVNGDVECSNVHFRYPTRPTMPILNGLDLSVLHGKTVALVGASGCGKSTIIQLIERFYDPTGGSVSLDDEDIKTIDIKNLRSHLGIVSQEPNLFNRTIAENIAYGANGRNVTTDEIIEAAKNANIHQFITSLPMGYETNLGSKGTQLSGGQKQRVAIARALIRNPRVLLLDEATSALDNESEKIVQEALDNARKNRTCITIAHRLTTIQDADLICVVADGVVVEMGKHKDLLEKKGLYYKFYKLQAGQK